MNTMQSQKISYSAKWYVMAAVAMGVFLATIDGSIVNIALPVLAKDLQVDFSLIEWVVLAYLLTITTLMLGIGRLADMIGKKKIYASGFVIFTIGSALCGSVNHIGMLIGFRVLQAVGASMLMALGTAIVTEAFPSQERGKALGIMGSVVSIGIIIGPTIGGLILEVATWQWLFFVNVPIGVIGVLMVLKYVPAIRPTESERFDFWGAGLLFVCLLTLLLGLSISQTLGFEDVRVGGLLITAAILLVGFILVELRQPQPMIDLRLFKNTLLSINLVTGFMSFIGVSGTGLLMPFYLQNILFLSPRDAGILMGVVPLVVGIVAPIAGNISDRIGQRPLTAIGLFVLIFGFLSVSSLSASTTALGYALRFLPVGLGLGLFQSPNNSAVMGSAPKNRLGIVSGMLAITRTLGQTTGIAILSAVWASRVGYYIGSGNVNVDATQAPIPAQIAGLHETIYLVVGLLIFAFLLSLWALYQVLGKKTAAQPQINQAAE
jgi:EmrB/QacA subfamily drug resistance transporter